jgi:hypothetical protein
MEGSTLAVGGSEVRFNHGVAVQEGRPGLETAITALRRATGRVSDDDAAAVMEGLFNSLVRRRQYTEGHHPVRVELSDRQLGHLRLAHMVAADRLPESSADIAAEFRENRDKLPASA